MLSFYLRLCITTIVVVLSAKYIPGLSIKNLQDAIFFGIILGAVNAFIRPLISLMTIPINLLTLGLFSLVINAFTFWLSSELAIGVEVAKLSGAFIGGGIIWVISVFSSFFVKEELI